jgi:hypothetical protein
MIYQYANEADEVYKQKNNTTDKKFDTDEQAVKKLYEDSLKYSNEKDIDNYLACIVPRGRKNTKKELTKAFKEYDIKSTLQSFEILKHEGDHILAETKQEQENLGKKEYKKHIATLNVAFIKNDGVWQIELTTVIKTNFVD